jgi:hypothetical protein
MRWSWRWAEVRYLFLAASAQLRRVSQRKGSLRYNKKMYKSIVTTNFSAALSVGHGVPTFIQITLTTTIKG